jgi:hypothetical protein
MQTCMSQRRLLRHSSSPGRLGIDDAAPRSDGIAEHSTTLIDSRIVRCIH